MLGGIKLIRMRQKLEFDFNKIGSKIKTSMKSSYKPYVFAKDKPSGYMYEDVGFASSWWVDDKPKLEEEYFHKIRALGYHFHEIKRINLRHMSESYPNHHKNSKFIETCKQMEYIRLKRHAIIQSFEDRLKKAYDDKTIPDGLKPTGLTVDTYQNEVCTMPAGIGDGDDMVVNDGMERFALLICNESNTLYTHYAIGASSIASGIGQFMLLDEKARSPFDEFGWFSAIGTLIRGGAEFPETIASFGIAESAACDASAGGTIAWRTAYSVPVQHTKDNTFPVASHVVYQVTAAVPP